MYVYIYIYIHTYVCMYVCMCVYIYIYIYIGAIRFDPEMSFGANAGLAKAKGYLDKFVEMSKRNSAYCFTLFTTNTKTDETYNRF